MKPRMTKQRLTIIQKLHDTPLAWGWGDKGGKEYFFTDGTPARATVVEGMLALKILQIREIVPGMPSQEIVQA